MAGHAVCEGGKGATKLVHVRSYVNVVYSCLADLNQNITYFSLSRICMVLIPVLCSQFLFKIQMLFYFSWKSRVSL